MIPVMQKTCLYLGRTTKQIVDERSKSGKPAQKDMLASFLAHGLTQEEACSETMLVVVHIPVRCSILVFFFFSSFTNPRSRTENVVVGNEQTGMSLCSS